MGRWPARPSISAIHSSQGLRARNGSSGCPEICPRRGGRLSLARSELPIDTISLGRYLIGKVLVRALPEGVASGRIVETEAYVVGDAAGHAYRGVTRRNRSLFLEPGHAYIYLAYGTSYMLNVSSELPGIGAGVLIRALEPLEGVPITRRNRGIERLDDLVRGPGRITAALRVDRCLDGSICVEKVLYGSDAVTIRRANLRSQNIRPEANRRSSIQPPSLASP